MARSSHDANQAPPIRSAAERRREIGRIRDMLEVEPFASRLHVSFTFHQAAADGVDGPARNEHAGPSPISPSTPEVSDANLALHRHLERRATTSYRSGVPITMSDRIVVVGGSLAALRAAEALRTGGHVGPITIIGEENQPPYDRPPLSKQVLTGKACPEDARLAVPPSLEAEWVLGARAAGLDLIGRQVMLESGEEVPFDGLVIATGTRPRILPGARPGPGVHYLRTLEDSTALAADLSRSDRTVIIGAGFIGLEVASSAASLGVLVTVLEALPVPLDRALGTEAGRAVMEWHLRRGIDIRAGAGVNELVLGAERPEAVRLHDGTLIAADTVVVGVGVAPCTDWLEGTGVDLMDGVLCDERLRVLSEGRPLPGVVAAGDVARWAHPDYEERVRIEHWTNAAEAGEAAANTLLRGDDAEPYGPVPYFWSDQHGVKLQFVGRVQANDETMVLEGSFDDDRVVIAYGREGRLVGALGMRRPARVVTLQRMIREGAPFPPET